MLARQLLESAGVRTKTLNKVNEFAICCPVCADSHFHFYINPVKIKHGITGWGYCHRRGCTMTLKNLFKQLGITNYKFEQQEYKPTTFELVKARLQNLETLGFVQEEEKQARLSGFDFDQFKIPYRKSSEMAKRAMAYLVKRGFTDEQIQDYKLRYCDEGDYSGRIIIPFFEDEELVYFQARGFTIATEQKILNPPLGAFMGGKSDYLFNFDQARLHRTVILNEGWASAMTAGYNAVAINGNKASDRQLDKIVETWNNYIVMLDYGVEAQAFRLAHELLFKNPRGVVKLVLLPYGDPNNFDPRHLEHLKNKSKVYKTKSEIDRDELLYLSERVQSE